MDWIIITVYVLSLTIISLFSLGQLNLTFHFLRSKNHKPKQRNLKEYPKVTVQLPVYNEKYVIERLLDSVASFDYPKDLLEIQVLDDSDDETSQIIEKKVAELSEEVLDIKHIRRKTRVGYKAGALQYGLGIAKGEFIAIFDADFIPGKDFLKRTLAYFISPEIGMIQTRWSHINENYNLLTKMQAFGLDAHFTIEQRGRNVAGSFMSFNGTGGIWRKDCITDAGGWEHDTLTEDLDLSYRAQLKGWKFQYVDSIESPAELPVIVPAVKSQQYRWNKGAAETARKNIGKILTSDLKLVHKTRSIMHLLNSSVFFFLLIASIFSIPMLHIKEGNPALKLIFDLGSIFIIGFVAIGIFYWVSSRTRHPDKATRHYLINFPLFLSFSMGLALHNSIAIIEGLLGIKTPFIRTPKFNIMSSVDGWKHNTYLSNALKPLTIIEGLLALYFVYGIFSGISLGDYGLILFHFMLAMGFGYVFTISLGQRSYAVR